MPEKAGVPKVKLTSDKCHAKDNKKDLKAWGVPRDL